MVDGGDIDAVQQSIEGMEKAGSKRQLDKEEIRDVCSASSQLLPEGMFTKAIKVLIWQGQLLRGIAQNAVQTELRSVLELAREEKESIKRRRCDVAASDGNQEQAEDSKSGGRNFDLDDFLAPWCKSCGWPSDGCYCTKFDTSTSAKPKPSHVHQGTKEPRTTLKAAKDSVSVQLTEPVRSNQMTSGDAKAEVEEDSEVQQPKQSHDVPANGSECSTDPVPQEAPKEDVNERATVTATAKEAAATEAARDEEERKGGMKEPAKLSSAHVRAAVSAEAHDAVKFMPQQSSQTSAPSEPASSSPAPVPANTPPKPVPLAASKPGPPKRREPSARQRDRRAAGLYQTTWR